ncbi:hypothetical protein [Rhodomicrobium lacus]|uniref:hypothetical protein n=1 Tax=Rhodomicrobium lacus TaxID=2498452 RepID=UPI001AED0F42|nr:hypothetical protein [Rhodomicrobium lacus]
MKHDFYLSEPSELLMARKRAKRLVYLDRHAPDLVFKRELGNFAYLDFNSFQRLTFGEVLIALKEHFGDHDIIGIFDYPLVFDRSGYNKAFRLKGEWTSGSWKQKREIPIEAWKENKHHTSATILDYIVDGFIFGGSEKWACYTDRDFMLTIFAMRNDPALIEGGWPTVPGIPWMTPEIARANVPAALTPEEKKIRDTFLKNYGLLE